MIIEISRVLHLTEFLMFRMFFIIFIHASSMTISEKVINIVQFAGPNNTFQDFKIA